MELARQQCLCVFAADARWPSAGREERITTEQLIDVSQAESGGFAEFFGQPLRTN